MDPTTIPKGQSAEKYTDGRLINTPGIYKHVDTGAEFITFPGEEGILQADALMSPVWRDKWERVGDVPSRVELDKRRKAQEIDDIKKDAAEKAQYEAEIKAATEEGTRMGQAAATPAVVDPPKESEAPATGGQNYTPEVKKEPAKESGSVK